MHKKTLICHFGNGFSYFAIWETEQWWCNNILSFFVASVDDYWKQHAWVWTVHWLTLANCIPYAYSVWNTETKLYGCIVRNWRSALCRRGRRAPMNFVNLSVKHCSLLYLTPWSSGFAPYSIYLPHFCPHTSIAYYCVVNFQLKIFNCFFNISRLYMNLTRINDTNKIVWEHLNIVGKQNSPEKSAIIHKHLSAR